MAKKEPKRCLCKKLIKRPRKDNKQQKCDSCTRRGLKWTKAHIL